MAQPSTDSHVTALSSGFKLAPSRVPLALEKMDKLIGTLEECRAEWKKLIPGTAQLSPTYRRLSADIKGQLPLVIDVAAQVRDDLASRLRAVRWGGPGFPFDLHLELLYELKSATLSLKDAGIILGTAGAFEALVDAMPSALRDVVARPLAEHRFADAVRAAAIHVLDQQLPRKTGVPRGKSAAEDVSHAFSREPAKAAGQRRLRRPGFEPGSADWNSAQEGAANLGMAAAKLRNLVMHGRELSEADALEQLAVFSLLARWIEEAAVEDFRP